MTPAQIAEVLARALDPLDRWDPTLAEQVHEATGGVDQLVHLTVETLRRDGLPTGDLAAAVTQPGGALTTYLTGEVLALLPPEAIRLLRQVGHLAPITAGLCHALGHRQATGTLELLRGAGLLTRAGSAPPVPGAPAPVERVVPVVAEVLRHGRRGPASRAARTARLAAAWYEEHGPPVAAARAFQQAGDDAGCARVLAGHGDRMIAAGHAAAVAELAGTLPEPHLTRRLRLLLGDALRTLGDLGGAERAYAAVAGRESEWDPALAWRIGRIHYQRGDARAALEAFARGSARPASAPETALLMVWTAHAHLLAGEVDTATGYARRAVTATATAGDDTALATAHLGLALCRAVAGDAAGSEEHFAIALPVAERAGDVLLLARIHTNQTYQFLRTGRYPAALEAARRSEQYATAAASPSLRAIATSNAADALVMLGRYDEAAAGYEAAVSLYQRKGSRRFAGARLGLAELYRRRGWPEQARAAYREAIQITGDTGNAHVLVPALAGLALVTLDDDPKAAAAQAEEAARLASAELVVPALLAQGWVAWHGGDRTGAAALATEAARLAGAQRDRAGIADALELRAATDTDPLRVREALREAHGIWREAGAELEAARIQVAIGQLPGTAVEDRLAGLLAAERLAAAGARFDRLGSLAGAANAGTTVAIQALGRFEVRLDGETVPASRWQSRKARDLLRILVARRGRPVPRGELSELLWPDDDPDRTGHRLSVLLSIVRGALDPAKAHPADRYLVADQGSIALDLSAVRVDVEEFLAQVAHARRLVEQGAAADARAVLAAADRQYRADVFEDEPYDDWSRPLREEARAAYLAMLRMLAQTSRVTAGPGAAVGYLLRLLERDPYDEPAHRGLVRTLVAAGQHGEARRAFDRYAEAMCAIGVRPPDRLILTPASVERRQQHRVPGQ